MDENESTSKRGNSLNEDERESLIWMNQISFSCCWKPNYPGFIEYSNTLSRFGTVPGFEGVLPLSITNATCRPRLALSRAYRSRTTTWRSSSMPPTRANVEAHAGFAYLSFR